MDEKQSERLSKQVSKRDIVRGRERERRETEERRQSVEGEKMIDRDERLEI